MHQSIDWEGDLFSKAGGVAQHNIRNPKYNQSAENIHPEKTHLNIMYFESRFHEALKKIGSVKIAGGRQKGTEEFTTYSIQSGSEKDHLNREQANAYFEKSIEWLKKYHGAENLVQAVAHYDETTPHLHVIVSNFTEDKENGKFYCSLKRSRGLVGMKMKELKQAGWDFQQKFYDEVSKGFGFLPPVKEAKPRGKVSIASWKKLQAEKAKTKAMEQKLKDALNENENIRSKTISFLNSADQKLAKMKKKLDEARGIKPPVEESKER